MSRKKMNYDPELVACLFSGFFSSFDETLYKGTVIRANEHSMEFKENLEDYLQKGKCLVDLARTVYKKKISNISLTWAEQRIFSFPITENMSMYEVIRALSRKFTRPCLKSMEKQDDVYATCLQDLVSIPGIKVSISFFKANEYPHMLENHFGKANLVNDRIIQVRFLEDGYEPLIYIGTKNISYRHKKDMIYVDNNTAMHIVDIADFFSALIIYTTVVKQISSFHQLTNTEKYCDELYVAFRDVIDAYTTNFLQNNTLKIVKDKFPCSLQDLESMTLLVEEQQFQDCIRTRHLLESKNVSLNLQTSEYSRRNNDTPFSKPIIGITRLFELGVCYLMEPGYTYPYHDFIYSKFPPNTKYLGLPMGMHALYSDTTCMKLFVKLFKIISEKKVYQKKTLDYYKSLEFGGHAKSFQLKRNISRKVLFAMKTSLFNDYFGFVEFDDETDLLKVEEIAKEFAALKEKYLLHVDSCDNTIRFRKLGNHKASGLYYPSLKCLCVDIHSPSSLTHEYGHLMDYTMGDLSSLTNFGDIKRYYINYLNEQIKKDADFAAQMASRSKYNMTYYTMPTEIFARSFEVFVSKVLNVKNSIVPSQFNHYIYPNTCEFLDMIEEYFYNLLELQREEAICPKTVRWLISYPVDDRNFTTSLENATAAEIIAALNDEHIASQKIKVAKLKSTLQKISSA